MSKASRLLVRNPAGLVSRGGNFAIQTLGPFEQNERPTPAMQLKERGIQTPSLFGTWAKSYFYAGLAKLVQSPAVDLC